jgi:hypothetical protein
MMVDVIPPSLRGSVDHIVALRGIPTRGHGARHVGIFIGTISSFRLNEIGLGMSLGTHGKLDGFCGLVLLDKSVSVDTNRSP